MLASIFSGASYCLLVTAKNKLVRYGLAYLFLAFAFGIYQPAAMSFVFFWFLDVCIKPVKINKKSFLSPTVLLGLGILTSFFYVKILPLLLYGSSASRASFVHNILYKITWFIFRPFNYVLGGPYVYLSFLSVAIGLCFFVAGLLGLPEELLLKGGDSLSLAASGNSIFEEGDYTIDIMENVVKFAHPNYGKKSPSSLKGYLKSLVAPAP